MTRSTSSPFSSTAISALAPNMLSGPEYRIGRGGCVVMAATSQAGATPAMASRRAAAFADTRWSGSAALDREVAGAAADRELVARRPAADVAGVQPRGAADRIEPAIVDPEHRDAAGDADHAPGLGRPAQLDAARAAGDPDRDNRGRPRQVEPHVAAAA